MADYAPYASFKAQSHLAQQQQQQNQYTNTYAPQQQQQTQTQYGGGYQAGYALYRLGGEEPTTTAQSQQYPASANSNSHSTLLSSLAPLANNSTSNSSTTTTNPSSNMAMATSNTPTPAAIAPPTALLWTDLEPWMDAEYARQVCALMRWEAAVIVPSPPNSLNINGGARDGGANNAGYAVLTFATAAGASRALAQVNSSLGAQMTMPNSARAFVLGWAPPGVVSASSSHVSAPNSSSSSGAGINSSSVTSSGGPSAHAASSANANATANGTGAAREPGANASGDAYPSSNASGGGVLSPTSPLSPGIVNGGANGGFPGTAGEDANGMGSAINVNGGMGVGANGYPKEYSIFVGDLAPETSNSDLVAVSCALFCFLVWEGGGAGFLVGWTRRRAVACLVVALSLLRYCSLFTPPSLLPSLSLIFLFPDAPSLHTTPSLLPPTSPRYFPPVFPHPSLPPSLTLLPSSSLPLFVPSSLPPPRYSFPSHLRSSSLPILTTPFSSLVFRNPVLGLRNDRAPKFIRPFASCKSAKIMLDPVTGVSRGYGFVRFTDEADQQRALIEMHGLYCLSRPMRISPATAKFKPPQPDLLPTSTSAPIAYPTPPGYPSTASLPTSVSDQPQGEQQQQQQSVSAPIAVPTSTPTGAYYPGADAGRERGGQEYINNNGGGQEYNNGGSGMGTSASRAGVEYFAQQYGGGAPSQQVPQQQQQKQQVGVPTQQQQQQPPPDEWRYTAQRAILGNVIGPNGEQSPLVGEDTLRTFFVPFGEIHYVKVPVGKHCGFVQFVRKADAERAIEKMQGFPLGILMGDIDKAAQTAAQAAQAAALAQVQAQPPPTVPQVQALVVPGNVNANANRGGGITPAMLEGMTHDQAVALLQKFGYAAFPSAPAAASAYAPPNPYSAPAPPASNVNAGVNGGSYSVGGGYGGGGSGGSGGGNTSPEAHRSGFHSSSSPSNSNVSDAYNSNANANGAVPHYTDESIKVRRGGGEEASFGYPARSAYEVPTLPSASATTTGSNPFVGGSTGTSSFSPFSPDPNQLPQQQQHQGQQQQQQHGAGGLYAAAEMFGKRRDSYAGQPYGQELPHPSKAYAPGFFPGWGGYGGGGGDGFAGSPPAFQANRYQRHAQPISRPNSGSARRGGGEFGLDAMHDLNGTLASLDLDQREERGVGGWGLLKSPTATEASVGGESSASGTSGTSGSGSGSGASRGGSVQFRMSMESP
ncbi:hypothetical protein B0H14DRAFT_3905863 [Mycena olivaceomarginata]|nr:hypothetical protein B0H14DRAFT_3905863 [Mycena olivaceomarginata]